MSVVVRCDGCGKEWEEGSEWFGLGLYHEEDWTKFDDWFEAEAHDKHACSAECRKKIEESEKE